MSHDSKRLQEARTRANMLINSDVELHTFHVAVSEMMLAHRLSGGNEAMLRDSMQTIVNTPDRQTPTLKAAKEAAALLNHLELAILSGAVSRLIMKNEKSVDGTFI